MRPVIVDGMLRGTCPVDLHPLAPIRVTDPATVRDLVVAARTAQEIWAAVPLRRRVQTLKLAAKQMLIRRQEALELLHDEAGKTAGEALMTEAIAPLQLVSDCARIVKPYLMSRRLPFSALAFPGKKGVTEIVPRGVVGIIAPWNYPLAYFFKPVFPALLCGNAVVLKPSEYAPRTALWFASILNEFLPPGLLTCVLGDREAGEALVRSGIDAVTFTGSFSSGKEVAKLAAEQMIPCSAELGGKDAAIVLADCALDRTVLGIMQWALHNSGQACGAIDRVYVEAEVADRFVERLSQAVSKLRVKSESNDSGDYDLGPVARVAQLEEIENLLSDALAKGAKLVCGGKRTGKGLWFEPTVLDHCDHTMRICREPTFGPVIPVIRAATPEQALTLANDSSYGLCGSVWSQDLTRATRIASRLQVGTAFINNHAFTGGVVAAPWTGTKQTGYGIANSQFGLAHYTRPRTQVIDRSRGPDIYWYPINGTAEELGHCLAEAQLGRISSALKIPFLIRKRKKEVSLGAHVESVSTGSTLSLTPVSKVIHPAKQKRPFRIPFFSFERAWCKAIFETLFLEDSGTQRPLPPIAAGESEREFEEYVDGLSLVTRAGIRIMLWMLGLSPWIVKRRLSTIHALSPNERLEVIEKLSKSDFFLGRQAVLVMKGLGALTCLKTTRIQPAKPQVARVTQVEGGVSISPPSPQPPATLEM